MSVISPIVAKAAINLNSFEGWHQPLNARLLIGYNVEGPDRRDRLVYLASVGFGKKPAVISPSVNSQLFLYAQTLPWYALGVGISAISGYYVDIFVL